MCCYRQVLWPDQVTKRKLLTARQRPGRSAGGRGLKRAGDKVGLILLFSFKRFEYSACRALENRHFP